MCKFLTLGCAVRDFTKYVGPQGGIRLRWIPRVRVSCSCRMCKLLTSDCAAKTSTKYAGPQGGIRSRWIVCVRVSCSCREDLLIQLVLPIHFYWGVLITGNLHLHVHYTGRSTSRLCCNQPHRTIAKFWPTCANAHAARVRADGISVENAIEHNALLRKGKSAITMRSKWMTFTCLT